MELPAAWPWRGHSQPVLDESRGVLALDLLNIAGRHPRSSFRGVM